MVKHQEKEISLLPLFESLLSRIGEHARKFNAPNEQKKALSFLYAATLSKLNTYKMQNKNGSSTINDLEKLKELSEKIAI